MREIQVGDIATVEGEVVRIHQDGRPVILVNGVMTTVPLADVKEYRAPPWQFKVGDTVFDREQHLSYRLVAYGDENDEWCVEREDNGRLLVLSDAYLRSRMGGTESIDISSAVAPRA